MKYLNLFLASLVVIFSSCGDDLDDNIVPVDENPIDNSGVTNYFPEKATNYWTYKTENISATATTIGRDSLYVGNDSIINAITYKRMKTKAAPTGFFCGALRNNGLRMDGKLMKLTGDVSVNVGASLPVAFSVTDFVIFKENATAGEEFGVTSGTITNTTAIQGIPLIINYALKAFEDGSLTTFSSNNVSYTDVKKIKLILTLNVTAQFGANSAPVLTPEYQDILVSYQYYAKDFGMIKSEAKVEYHLNPVIASLASPPIPVTGTQTINDYLLTKLIN
jgi:hypothetical protein